MGGLRSRNKGKRGEREIVQLLQPALDSVYAKLRGRYPQYSAHLETPRLQRNQLQSDGGGFDICGLDWLAAEVKNQEKLNVVAAWAQCCKQAGKGQDPVLFYKRNGSRWTVRLWVHRYLADGTWWSVCADVAVLDYLDLFERQAFAVALQKLGHTTVH